MTEVRKVAHEYPQGDPDELARGLAKKLAKDDLIVLLAADIEDEQRNLTRSNEKSAFASLLSKGQGTGKSGSSEGLRGLFKDRFALGDGLGGVEWGKATIEQHRTRIAMLEVLRDGIHATIQRHEEAITIIETAGVTCLEEALAIQVTA